MPGLLPDVDPDGLLAAAEAGAKERAKRCCECWFCDETRSGVITHVPPVVALEERERERDQCKI